jgi:hypothetical protein
MKVIAIKNIDMEIENGWFILVESPVAKLAIHDLVATAACSTDDPGPDCIKDFKLQKRGTKNQQISSIMS